MFATLSFFLPFFFPANTFAGGYGYGTHFGMAQVGINVQQIPQRYYAPDPNSPIPLHVQRRIMRFCTKNPENANCRGHPEWIFPKGSLPEDSFTSGDADEFPKAIKFTLPSAPKLYNEYGHSEQYPMSGVPESVKNTLPSEPTNEQSRALHAIMNTCARTRDCLVQKPESINMRARIAEQEVAMARQQNPTKPLDLIDAEVEVRMVRSFQVKQSLVKLGGLEKYLVPANNGIYQEDILLSESQSNNLINKIQSQIDAVDSKPPVGSMGGEGPMMGMHERRRKRAGNSIYFEAVQAQRWPRNAPIKYLFHATVIYDVEKEAIRSALSEISTKAPCLSFQEVQSAPSGPHILYVKAANPGFCGQSYIGKQEPANYVYLSFACGNPMGVALHETLHALGLEHEQMRIDRDRYIQVEWENINPQNYDAFRVADKSKFTSYGINYDYGSIMHYASTVGTRDPTHQQKSMSAKISPETNNPLMGQRNGLAPSDVQELHKMYCLSDECADHNVYCGAWAVMKLCTAWAQGTRNWMTENCPKSCGVCSV